MKTKNLRLGDQVCNLSIIESRFIGKINRGSNKHSRTISFLANNQFEDVYTSPGSILFTQSAQQNKAGQVYDQKILVSVPGLDPESLEKLDNYSNKLMVCKITFQSGLVFLIGSRTNPVRCTYNYNSSNQKTAFVFSRFDTNPAFLLES